MPIRWIVVLIAILVVTMVRTATAGASTESHSLSAPATPLRRCENNYDDEELAAIYEHGDDYYEPDDCPPMAHTLTGPQLHNFCLPGDEDWMTFRAQTNLIYQITAAPQWNYPTEPRMELFDEGGVIAQNDHYFGNNAEIWWWNSGPDRWVQVRVTELAGRFDCGNSEYTLSLHTFTEKP